MPESAERAAQGRRVAPGPLSAPALRAARRDFRLLWAGQSVNMLGDQFMVVALPLLAVTALHASPSQAALLPFALNLPFLVIGLPAGVIADRFRRRSIMLGCESVQVAAFGLIAGLAERHMLTFPLLLTLVGVAGCATVLFQVAYPSFLPALFADKRALHSANTRLVLSESMSLTLGPLICGPLIAVAGTLAAVTANIGSFLLSIAALLGIRHREPRHRAAQTPAGARRGSPARDIREGLSFVLHHPQLEPVFTCGSVYVIFLSMVQACLVVYCRYVLHLSAASIGLVVGMAAVGFPFGNMISGRLMDRLGIPRTLLLGASVSVTGLILMPLAGSAGSAAGLVGGSIVHGLGEGSFNPTSLTLRQVASPHGLLGRVNAVQRFLIWGMFPVGSGLASLLIALLGLRTALWVGGAGTALCLPALCRRGIRAGLREGREWAVDTAGGPAPSASPSSSSATAREQGMPYATGIAEFVDRSNKVLPPDFYLRPVAEQRRLHRGFIDEFPYELPPDVAITDELVRHDGRSLPVRVYRPARRRGRGAVLYIRGGGFVIGSLDTHHSLSADLAAATGLVTIALDFRMAPEHPFPAALEDCYGELCAIAAGAGGLDIDAERIVLTGDSSGANMTVVICMMSRDRAGPAVRGQALISPVLDFARWQHGGADAPLLTGGEMRFFTACYSPDSGDLRHPYISPLISGEFHGLPPAYIMGAEMDPLRADAIAYAARLRDNGIAAELVIEPGLVHSPMRARSLSPQVAAAWARFCDRTGRLAGG